MQSMHIHKPRLCWKEGLTPNTYVLRDTACIWGAHHQPPV